MAEEDRGTQQAEDPSTPDFKVTDRRHFTTDGERRREIREDDDETSRPPDAESPVEEPTEPQPKEGFERRPLEEPEGVDFTMLLNAMAQPALLFLGEMPHPSTGQTNVDLEQARIQIDMLDLLRVKCRGNLTREEEGLLDRVLYQLRMVYVARSDRAG